ncbi:unnamed protein product [Sphagnum troendelagicum]
MVVERRREGEGEDDQKVVESIFEDDDDSWREKNLWKGKLVLLLCTHLWYTNNCDSNPRISGVGSQARRKLSSIADNVVLFNILQLSPISFVSLSTLSCWKKATGSCVPSHWAMAQ